MKLQTIVYAVMATTSIGTAAKSIRGGNNVDDENANAVNPSNVDGNTELNIDEPDSDGNQQQQQPQRDLHARHIPYRMFADGVDPELRDATEGGPSQQAAAEAEPSTSNGILSRFDNLFDGSRRNEVDPDTRIIGGSQAGSNEFPYSVSMQDYIGHFCGGSLIAPNLVLTAAHCLGGSYDVVVGKSNLNSNSGPDPIPMQREIKHPNYNPSTTNNDFAILVLESSVPNPEGKMVKLNSAGNYPSVGSSTTVMGYGDTTQSSYTSQLSDKLMKVNVNVISNSDCDDSSDGRDDYYDQITGQMICARVNGGGKDACQGDSGGPLVVQTSGTHTQVGVVSWGIGCATAEFPGVYARVSSAYNWIRDEVCDRADGPPSWYNCPGSSGGGSPPTPPNPPSPNPPSPSPPSPSPPSGGGGAASDSGNWRTVMSESFSSGMGKMKKGGNGSGNDARWYSSAKFRDGILKLQNRGAKASVSSSKVDVRSYNKCRVSSNFMTIGFESGDKFCIDYSYNNSSWNQATCYGNSSHNGKRWWDNQKTGSFSVKNKSDVYIRIRMVGDSRKDDVLIDEADVECSK